MRWRRGGSKGGVARPGNARWEMVADQLVSRDVTDRRVLEAMGKVPRERFVPGEAVSQAYADEALSIGFGQTISQPYMVAYMTQAMELSGEGRALEVGTGSGYQAAILGELCREVYTIERVAELSERARRLLEELGYSNIHFRVGDGTLGWAEEAPFEGIVVTAAAPRIPRKLVEQLEEGGRLVIPVGDRYSQTLVVGKRRGVELEETSLCRCVFVPLIGENGWQE